MRYTIEKIWTTVDSDASDASHYSCARQAIENFFEVDQLLETLRVSLCHGISEKRDWIFLNATKLWRRCECRWSRCWREKGDWKCFFLFLITPAVSFAKHDVAVGLPKPFSRRVEPCYFFVSRRARALVCLQRKTSKTDNGRAHWRHRAVEAFSPSPGLSEVFHISPRSRSIA